MTKKVLAFILVLVLLFAELPAGMGEGLFDAPAYADGEIPEPVVNLPESAAGDEKTSGEWRYVLREDGYAVITGYDGTETEVEVPYMLDGFAVVALASGALTKAERVKLHVNILQIAEDAFGDSLQGITAPNGTVGLYWAETHGVEYSTGKDYDLVPGVIDYTDCEYTVRKRGEEYVVFSGPEGLQLEVGSLFFMRDTRGMEFFYRVTELQDVNGQIIASVVIPDVKDAIINYETTVTVYATADDFTPAEGVEVADQPLEGDTISHVTETKSIPLKPLKVSGKTKYGKNKSTTAKWSGSVEVEVENSITYTILIEDSDMTVTDLTKNQSYSITPKISCGVTEEYLKQRKKAREILDEAEKGEELSEKDKSFLKELLKTAEIGGGFDLDDDFYSHIDFGFSLKDIEAADKALDKYADMLLGAPMKDNKEIGEVNFYTPYFNICFSVGVEFEISGSISYTYKHSNVTKEHYDFAADEWVVDYSNGNSSDESSSHSIKAQFEGKIGVSVEVSVGFFILKNLSFEFELGIKATVSKVFVIAPDPNGCTELEVTPYASVAAYSGVWVGKATGAKITIYSKEWTLQELIGKEYLLKGHINVLLDPAFHKPDKCPLLNAITVHYETKTSKQLPDRTVKRGFPLTKAYNYTLEDSAAYGKFLGWAYSMEDTTTTAADKDGAFKDPTTGKENEELPITGDITLYAIWEKNYTVKFANTGDSTIPDQLIPSGGYVTPPERPTKKGEVFEAWVLADGTTVWDFEKDTVTKNLTLYARWIGGTEPTGGAPADFYIGDINDVSSACRFDPAYHGQSSHVYFSYEERTGKVQGKNEEITYVVITGLRGSPEHLVIPKELPSKSHGTDSMLKVNDIDNNAFQNCESLKSVHFLPDDDNQYDTDNWFKGCTNLEYVEMPLLQNGVVGSYTFNGCSSLKCVKFRKGTKSFGSYAFYGWSGPVNVTIPEFITEIGSSMFNGFTGMKSVEIHEDVTSIGSYAFSGCSGLTSVTVPESVTSIGGSAFNGCSKLESMVLPFVGESRTATDSYRNYPARFMWIFGNSESGSQYVPASLKTVKITDQDHIAHWAFYYCSNLTKIILPEGVTSIGNYAFEGCSGLSDLPGSIVFPSTLTSIGDYAFRDCSGLTKANIPEGVTSIGYSAFSGCSGIKELTIPDTVTSIGSYAFSGCSGLTSVTVPESVTSIGGSAFNGCSKLESMVLPFVGESRTATDSYRNYPARFMWIFGNSESGSQYVPASLKTVKITDQDHIAHWAFYYCSNLTKIILPEGVTSIGNYAFEGCSGLSDLQGSIVFPSTLTSIGDYAFRDCSGLTKANIPEGVTSIGISAFSGCSGIKELTIPDTVTSIGSYAFSGCSGLTSVTVPESVTSIGYYAFYGCSSVESMVLPFVGESRTATDSNGYYNYYRARFMWIFGNSESGSQYVPASLKTVKITDQDHIAHWAFYYCSNLTKIILPEGVTSIGNYAFEGCSGLSDLPGSIVFPSTLTSIGDYAFRDCSGLTKANIPEGVTSIGISAFSGCSGIKELTIPDTVTSIGSYAFSGCTGLTSVTVPESVTSIGNSAFYGCSSVESMVLPFVGQSRTATDSSYDYPARFMWIFGNTYSGSKYVPASLKTVKITDQDHIAHWAFLDCKYLTKVIIPEGVTSIGSYAFSGCSGLTDMDYYCVDVAPASNAFTGCTALTVHLSKATEAVQAYFDSKNIPYDFAPGVQFTLTLDANGGELTGESSFTYNWLDKVELTDPVWDGHEFGGWYLDAEATEAFDGVMPAKDLTIYAGWDTDIFTLTVVPGMGAEEYSMEVKSGTAVELQEPSADGHIFTGWYEDADFFAPFDGTMPAKNLTLYASWDKNIYTLTTVPGNGSESASHKFAAGTKVEIATPARDGYFFCGWYLDAECRFSFDGTMPYCDTTIYAGWGEETTSILYTLTDSGAIMTGFLEAEDTDSYTVYLPEKVGGATLVGIAEDAFAETSVREVYIPATVTDVSPFAFRDSKIRTLFVHENNPVYSANKGILYSRDGSALLLCPPNGHSTVKIPEGVTAIGDYAFYDQPLSAVTLPETLLSIASHAFAETDIQELVIPASVNSIGERAFSGCKALYKVTVNGSPEFVGDYAFANGYPFMAAYGPTEDCPIHAALSGYWYNAYTLTVNYYTGTRTNTVTAGTELMLSTAPETAENTEFTGWFTDKACTVPLETTVMPCADLTLWQGSRKILLYETLTDEESNKTVTITGCSSASPEIVIPETLFGNPVTAIAAGSFSADYVQVEVPASVVEIGEGAFAEGTTLICAPGSFAEQWAKDHGFTASEKLWTLSYATGWREIEPVKLLAAEPLVLPALIRDGYTLDGWFADAECTEPVTETDPMGVGDRCVYAAWTVEDEEASALGASFETTEEDGKLTITAYTGNGGAVSIPAMLHGKPVTGIASYAFAFNGTITEITVPESVIEIGQSAFFGMTALKKAVVSASVIPESAFANCANLAEVQLSEGVREIKANAFAGCEMQTITLPASLMKLDASALRGCTALTEISVADGNKYYESRDGVLYDTADDALVKYPAAKEDSACTVSAYSVGAWAFEGAAKLSGIDLSNVWTLGEGAFAGCSGLTELPAFDPMVTKLPDNCFTGCTGLTNVTLPATVKQLGKNVFSGCSLDTLTVTDKLTAIGSGAVDSDTVVYGTKDCYAKEWCKENNIAFRVLGTVSPVSLSVEDITLKRGESAKLTVTAEPRKADLSLLSMSSSDPSKVYLDADGTVYGLAGGTASIYISDPGGAFTVCTVTVEVDVTEVKVSEHSLALDDLNSTAQLTARVLPDSATNKAVTWSSSDESIATVSETGLVTMTGCGTAEITVTTHNGLTDVCTVECTNHPSVTLTLPAFLKRIEAEAFAGVTAKVIVVPEGVTEIGSRAFADCPNLRRVIFLGKPASIAEDYLDGCGTVDVVTP